MLEIFSGLDTHLIVTLIVSVFLVLAFEFINGFHDTANAVATVIYTQSMKPQIAVLASGVFNCIGVLSGGLAVAYAIVHLLPVDLLVSINTTRGMVMVFALLTAAISWNLGTWYFGLPASSSHTLIGSILGVGLANAWLSDQAWTSGVNWSKAIDVGMSLLVSPLVGFGLAGLMVWLLRRFMPLSNVHKSPYQRQQVEGRKHPPFWTRFMLIISAMGVSFAHGSNDGQKGVGLVMLVLIGIVPAHFVLNINSNAYHIERTRDAVGHVENFYLRNQALIAQSLPPSQGTSHAACNTSNPTQAAEAVKTQLANLGSYRDLSADQRWQVRVNLLCLAEFTQEASKIPQLSEADQKHLSALRADISFTTEYAPLWVIIAIAIALGTGTMVGWRRVVKTVGEGIGKRDMTYAQGVCAQMTAAISIGLANVFGLPVSTTQVLSSGVAGTMVAERAGLKGNTVRNILLAWLFTMPAGMILSAGLYYLGTRWFA